MSDSYSEVSSQSWFDRIGGAIKGVLVGLLLFVISFPLLWWNEGRAVHTAKGLQEAGGSVASVSADKVDAANDKKLVHMTAMATTDETLADPDFAISQVGIKLHRKVEMYQWTEKESKETKKKLGGGEETVTTYTYSKDWSEKLIRSSDFKKNSEEHMNPESMRFADQDYQCKKVAFGGFTLPLSLVSQINSFEPITVDAAAVDKLAEPLKKQSLAGNNMFWLPNDPKKATAPDPQKPEIGDVRVSFAVVKPAIVSIMARQLNDTFEPWTSSQGTDIDRLMPGDVSAQNMVAKMESENTTMTWILRAVGFALMGFGLAMVFQPLVVVADVLPILGNVLGMGVGLFAFVTAAALSLVTIAIAWLAYRPVLGVGLIVVAVGLLVGLKMLNRKKAAEGPGPTPAPARA